jgi:hypothetical protein
VAFETESKISDTFTLAHETGESLESPTFSVDFACSGTASSAAEETVVAILSLISFDPC